MQRAAAVLFSLGVLAFTVWGWRVVHTPLEPIAARALSSVSGIDAAEISVGRARLAGFAVELDDVQVASAFAQRIRVGFDRKRAVISGFRLGSHFRAAEVALELDHGRLHRAAFAGGSVGPLGDLAGVATREGDAISVRAARPGLLLQGQVGSDEHGAARVELEKLPLDGLLPHGFDGARATVSGALELRRSGGRWVAGGRLDIDELAVEHRAISARRIEHLSPRLEGELALFAGTLSSDGVRLTLGPLTVVLSGQVDSLQHFDLSAQVEPLACAETLTALRSILPALDGMLVDGRFAGRAQLSGDAAQLADLQLGLTLDVGCRVDKDAPLADVTTLRGPVAIHPQDPSGKARTFVLGPLNPAWKRLSALPVPVIRAFLAAEDGRFFRHHGFDPEMIRRALAHDLTQGRIDKGASTLTQQLVKNVFLSGERTAARKLEEAVLAWRAEQVLDKRRILELYLNLVELAPGAYGIGEGAERYFGKEPEELTADEGAQLAALLPAPRRGMDAAWDKRYQALKLRLPSEKIELELSPRTPPVKLTRR